MKPVGRNTHSKLHNVFLSAVLAFAALGLASCDNKELCYNHREHAMRYEIYYRATWHRLWHYPSEDGIDWQSEWASSGFGIAYDDLCPLKPEGIRVQVYTDRQDNEIANIPADGGIVNMTPGEHQILFYNNGTEYIVFNDIHSSAKAKATTRSRSRATYIGNSAVKSPQQENTVNPPDPLFGHYIDSYYAEKVQVAPVVGITMKPLVFRYLVRYRFDHGLQYVALGRGALSGMAASVYLTDGHTGNDAATVLFDCKVKPWGIEAVVNTFGVPNYPNPDYSRVAGVYGLNLEVKLANGRMVSFDFDVSGQIAGQPRGGVIEVGGIDIPDELGKEETGSFSVGIDGWGEYEDIIIDFGEDNQLKNN